METKSSASQGNLPVYLLAVDILESKDHIEIWASLPGVEKSDFDIQLENNELLIRAQRKNPAENGQLRFLQQEMRYGVFERSFTLSKNLDTENIKAVYENGVLKIKAPKLQPISKVVAVG